MNDSRPLKPEKKKVWFGSTPKECDLCHEPITYDFVDGATFYGPWAIMCVPCHQHSGKGLGTGRGQQYQLRNNRYEKVEG